MIKRCLYVTRLLGSLMSNKKMIMITNGRFPDGDAGAVRLFYVAKIFKELGYQVKILCRGKVRDQGCVEGIEYVSLRNKDSNRFVKYYEYFFFPHRVRKIIQKEDSIAGLYIYTAPNSVFRFYKKFASKNSLPLLYDSNEWYSPEQFKHGEKSYAYREKNRLVTKIIDKSYSVVAISRFLEEYYRSKNIQVFRLPILCAVNKEIMPKIRHEGLHLFYAGAPGKKDLIANVLKAVLLLSPELQEKVRITLMGATRDHLIGYCGISADLLDSCSGFLELCGRVSRLEVLEKLREADFTLLPRDASLRYAKAGFPSKVVESLAHSTPILCNLSSDLELYLKDGENALIAEDHTPESLAKVIKRAIALTAEEKEWMFEKSYNTAKCFFDYRIYKESFSEFIQLQEIMKGRK